MFAWLFKSNLQKEIAALKAIGRNQRARSQSVKEWN